MKKSSFWLAALLLAACNTDSGKSTTDKTTDSAVATKPFGTTFLLDSLLLLNSEAEFKQQFGAANITYDTAWGPEGMYWMSSYLFKGTPDEVQLSWTDSLNRSGLVMVKIAGSIANENAPVRYTGHWHTAAGVLPGQTIQEVETINGKPFSFSGFGWDYGGAVTDWNNGKLEKSGITAQLREDPQAYEKLEQEEIATILGEQEVKSDAPIFKNMKVQLLEVFLSPDLR